MQFLQLLVFPVAPPSEPLVIEPVVDVHYVNLGGPQCCNCAVNDPLSQLEEGGIVSFRRNEFNH